MLVLNEADRILDMGFADDIDEVISETPPQCQTLLFSATYPADIERISALMTRLCIDGGRKAKIRPGDILGALTSGDIGLTAAAVGKIDMFPQHAYVAIHQDSAHKAMQQLQQGKIKGKRCKVRLMK